MGLADTIKNAVQSALVILDDLAPAQTYVSVNTASGSYDTATGVYTPAGDTPYSGVKMVLARFSLEEIDNEIVPTTDMKAIIAALDLPATPKNQDRIVLASGAVYMVERVMGVPGESVHILHIRRNE